MRRWTVIVVAVLLLVGACGGDGGSDDQLAEVTAERDALQAQLDAAEQRHDRSAASQQAVAEIIADPEAVGTESEVLDLLDQYAESPSIPYVDDALGETTWRIGWRDTLFSGVDANLESWVIWLADDGSTGGSLWSWNGTAANGEPFSLSGIVLEAFNDEGLYEALTVYYPMSDDEVQRAFAQGNL